MPVGVELPSFFVKPELEKALLAAIAARPELYWEVLDLLPPEALTETRKAFEDLAAAIEQEKPLPKLEGEPAGDPIAAAKELAGLYQRRLLAALAQEFLDDLARRGFSAHTVKSYRCALRALAEALNDPDASEVSQADLARFLAWDGWSAETRAEIGRAHV